MNEQRRATLMSAIPKPKILENESENDFRFRLMQCWIRRAELARSRFNDSELEAYYRQRAVCSAHILVNQQINKLILDSGWGLKELIKWYGSYKEQSIND